jgi:Flp pilus assembly protein TadD
MKSEIIIRLADLEIPNLPTGPVTIAGFKQRAIRAVEDYYLAFQQIGKLEVTLQGKCVRITLTTDDRVNPLDTALSEIRAGRVSEGVSILRLLHASTPDDPDVLYFLGSSLSDLGDLERAERALEIRPNFPDALINLGVVLSRMNKTDEAIKTLKKALELNSENAFALRNLGACIAKLGRDVAAAQTHLEHAVRLAPADIQAWLGLARVYQSQGNTAAARNACTRVLQIGPQSPLATYAQAMLKQL